MLFINQNDYENMPYPTDAKNPDSENMLKGTIASSGCGLCSCCMMVDRLTLQTLTLEECRQMAIDCGANMDPGTDKMCIRDRSTCFTVCTESILC